MALGLQFYLDADGRTVLDNQGRPVSLDDYKRITGQQSVPDAQINWSYVQKSPPPTQGAAPVQEGGGQPGQTGAFTTGVPQLDAMYQRLDKYITDLAMQGKKINPNIELSPDTLKQFLDQATNEVEPYYQQQFKVIKDDVGRNIETLKKQYELAKKSKESEFKSNLESTRESAVNGVGTFSSRNLQNQNNLASSTGRDLESLGLSASNAIGDTLRAGEKTIGTRNISSLGIPSLETPSVSTSGLGSFGTGRSLDFYSPQNVTGSLEYAKNNDVRTLQDFLKQQEVQKRTLSFAG